MNIPTKNESLEMDGKEGQIDYFTQFLNKSYMFLAVLTLKLGETTPHGTPVRLRLTLPIKIHFGLLMKCELHRPSVARKDVFEISVVRPNRRQIRGVWSCKAEEMSEVKCSLVGSSLPPPSPTSRSILPLSGVSDWLAMPWSKLIDNF